MNTDRAVKPSIDVGPRALACERSELRLRQRLHRPPPDAGGETGAALRLDPKTVPPGDPTERPVESASPFSSVLCAVDRSANSHAARRQAALLALPRGTVHFVAVSQLTRHGHHALRDACEAHDLLVLGASAAAFAAVEHTPIPILIARRCPLGTNVTDTILVPVDASPESGRAAELAGGLAAVHDGTVSILGAPALDPALQRAIAASGRILMRATGAVPRLFGQQLPRERAIPSAAVALAATLVVLGSGSSENARRMTAHIAGYVGCSVLAVPTVGPTPRTPEQPLVSS